MRKSVEKNDRPDRSRNLSLSPLMHTLLGAFRLGKAAKEVNVAPPSSAASQPAIRFEALEPRVLLSGDVNPAALSIDGTISVQGEQDQFEFSVEEQRRVVFDSLTNRSDLNWKLEGPNGQIGSDRFSDTNSPAYALDPGKYKITVDADSDALGDYSLRIIDADAAADMTPGHDVNGTLNSGNKTAVYRFSATAGNKFFFDANTLVGGSASWQLINPYGHQEAGSENLGYDQDTFAVQRTGEYLLLVNGSSSNTNPVDYSFNLRPVVDSTEALILGATTSASIDQPGKTCNFTFSLTEPQLVLFDRLTNSNFYWSLSGPEGVVVSRISASYGATTYAGGFGRLLLPAGDYTLSVDTYGATSGSLPFRLLVDDAAEMLETGATTTAALDNACGSKLYKVALKEGDKIFVDGRTLTGGTANWSLINPYGIQLASSALLTAQAPLTVTNTGDYWLVVEGGDDNVANTSVSYQFAINKVPDVSLTLTLGSQVTGSVDLAGQATVYSFELAAATQLAFDAQSNRSDMLWSLVGPRGSEVSARGFNQSDAGSALSVLALPAGSYRLVVQGSGRASGNYAFQMFDLSLAQTLSLDTSLTSRLTPGNSLQAYRFSVAPGDMLAFQTNSVSGGNASWRLVDSYGRDVAGSNNLAINRVAFALTTGGTYTLLVEGSVDNTAAVDFDIQFNAAGNQAPAPLPAGEELILGTAVAGTFETWDATKTYRFTLASDALVVMDTLNLSASSALWSLAGPRGTEVSLQQLYSSDANYNYPVFSLPAGSYALTVQGAHYSEWFSSNGAYTFRLLDTASFSALTLGQQVSVTRSPTNSTLGYRFEASAGNTMVLNWSDNNYSIWTLIDPYGRKIQGISGDNAGTSFTIPVSGTYTLLNEGNYYSSGTTTVTFTLAQQNVVIAPLVFNDQASGTLSGRQAIARYDFTLDKISPLVFDALNTSVANAGNLQWLLRGPRRDISGWNSFTDYRADSGLGKLPPGKYSLLVRNTTDTSSAYSFRMLNRDAAVSLLPGTPVNDTIPAGESRIYRFNGNAGDRYYFDGQDPSWYNHAYWCLLDQFGRNVINGNTSQDYSDIQLPSSGEYLLVVTPTYTTSISSATPHFNLLAKTTVSDALVVNQDTTGSIANPGQTVKYGFTLAVPTRIMVDAWDGGGLYWNLSGPRGSEASGNSFGSTPRYFDLPTGNYDFTVSAYDLRTGAFHFRLSDLAALQSMAIDTETVLSHVANDRSQTYRRIDLSESTELLIDAIGSSNPYASWALYDSRGQVRSNGDTRYDSSRFTLAAGSYYLVVYSASTAAAEYKLALRRPQSTNEILVLDSMVSSSLLPAEEYRYSFDVSAPTTLLFESQTDSYDLRWELSGPSGIVRIGSFSDSIGAAQLGATGHYILRVYSQSNVASDFSFRLLDLHAVMAQVLPVTLNLSLTPENRTQIYAFDAVAGDVFAYQNTNLSVRSSVSMSLFDPLGNRLDSMGVDYDSSRRLSSTGRYYLVITSAPSMQATVDLSGKLLLAKDHAYPLTVDTACEGSIDSSQTSDTWTFTLNANKRLLLDGLKNSNLNWRLQDADGVDLNRSGRLGDLAVLNLSAGSYRLNISATSGALGAYNFRLFDTAGAVPLVERTATTGSLASDLADVYSLNGQPGQQLNLATELTNAQARAMLFDAMGNYVWSSWGGDTYFTVGDQPGNYLLVLDRSLDTTESVAYTVMFSQPQEKFSDASIGDVLSGHLPNSYEFHSYQLNLSTAQRVIIADTGTDAGLTWRIVPQGMGLQQGGWRVGSNVEYLGAGSYVLTVSSSNHAGGDYRIQLRDPRAAAALPETGVVAQLADGRDAAIYVFDSANTGRLKLGLSTANPAQIRWTLYDENFHAQLNVSSGVARDTDQLSAGRHYLVVYGKGVASEPIDYTLNVTPISATPVMLEETIHAAFPTTGDEVDYTFSLIEKTTVLFDVLQSGTYGFRYTLYNESGYDIAWSMLDNENIWPSALEAGNYRLKIQRNSTLNSDVPADPFAFRLSRIPQLSQGVIDYGMPVSGTLADGTQAMAYQIDMQAGDWVSFSEDSVSAGRLQWRLIGPNGDPLYWASNGDRTGIHVVLTGRYTVLLDGALSNSAALDYQFTMSLERHVDNRPAGDPLSLGTLTNVVVPANTSTSYRFHLDSDTVIAISGKRGDGHSLQWQLQGVESHIVSSSFSELSGSANIYQLSAGEYALTLTEASGMSDAAVAFRIEDRAHAQTVVTEGDIVTAGAHMFKATLMADETLYVRSPGQAHWRIYGPDNSDKYWAGGEGSSVFNFTANSTGEYLFILEQDYSASPVDAKLELRHRDDRTSVLALDTVVSGSHEFYQTDSYVFTLAERRQVFLDLQSSTGDFSWTLFRNGNKLANGSGDGSALASLTTNPLLDLAAGDYVLKIVPGSSQSTTYKISLRDLARAAVPSLNGDTLTRAVPGVAQIFKFDAKAGDSFIYLPGDVSVLGYSRLFAADGSELSNGSDNADFITFGKPLNSTHAIYNLPETGSYYLLLDSQNNGETDPVDSNFAIRVITPETPVAIPALGQTVNGYLASDGRLRRSFHVDAESNLFIDMLSNTSLSSWEITSAQGHFYASGNVDGKSSILAHIYEAGDYTLTLSCPVFDGSAVSFRLLDLADSAQEIEPDVRVDGQFNAGSAKHIYRFNALSSDSFKFVTFDSNLNGGLWRLYSRNGSLVGNGDVNSNGNNINLNSYGSGQYYLLIDCSSATTNAGTYGFSASLNRIVFDTVYSGTTSYFSPTHYKLHLDQATWLDFDAFKAASGGTRDYYGYWTLAGADGQIFSTNLYYNSESAQMLAAGDYTLTISSSDYFNSTPYQFRILSSNSAEAMTPGSTVSVTLSPGNSSKLYSFDGLAGEVYSFRSLQSISGYWRLIDPEGKEGLQCFHGHHQGNVESDQDRSLLAAHRR